MEMLKIHKLLKVTWYEANNQTSPRWNQVLNKQTNILWKKVSLTPDGFTVEFYKTHEKQVTSILYIHFQKAKKEGIIHNSFYETSIILKPKPKSNKDSRGKKKERKKKKTIDQYPPLIMLMQKKKKKKSMLSTILRI